MICLKLRFWREIKKKNTFRTIKSKNTVSAHPYIVYVWHNGEGGGGGGAAFHGYHHSGRARASLCHGRTHLLHVPAAVTRFLLGAHRPLSNRSGNMDECGSSHVGKYGNSMSRDTHPSTIPSGRPARARAFRRGTTTTQNPLRDRNIRVLVGRTEKT